MQTDKKKNLPREEIKIVNKNLQKKIKTYFTREKNSNY